ncbi:Ferric reductase like transmembrane component [Blastocladiella emersonii ATCC 22665]|nr:Ferric reductase like transmembrane component [Blastocladiella emersonii ATCC 22665]KAI9149717.1 Ferric reductase like transmembrane component [Blastocladiella emersonii ATCC 22665]
MKPRSSSSSPATDAGGSRVPALLVTFFLLIAYLFSLFRDLFRTLAKVNRNAQISTNGLVWYTDGLHVGVWALSLFLASAVVLACGTRGMRPLTNLVSPDRAVFWLLILIAVANVWWAAQSLIIVYVLNTPRPNQPWTLILEMVSRRIAHPLFWGLAWIFVFAMRSPALAPLQAAFGIAYEHSVVLHRAMGWWSMFWVVIHSIGYLVVFIAEGELDAEFRWKSPHGILNNAGAVGTALFVLIGLSSVYLVRRKQFKIFAWIHWLWMPACAFAILHIGAFTWPMLPPMALFIIDRIACLWGAGAGHAGAVTSIATAVRVSDDVVALLIPVGPARDENQPMSQLDVDLANTYQPGRYLSLSFPLEVSPASHPFSIAAYSPKNRTVSIMIRALGPWTKRLYAMGTVEGAAVSLRVAGPFSHSALAHDHLAAEAAGQDAYGAAEKGVPLGHRRTLIAGGVGISKYAKVVPVDDSYGGKGKLDVVASSTTVAAAGNDRQIWLCKDEAELVMYASLGTDLAGWEVYSRKGFASVVPENKTAVRSTYPLFAQRVAAPLSTAARLLIFGIIAGLCVGTYLVSRLVITLPDPKKTKLCSGRSDTIEKFMRCSRWFNMIPFLSILVGLAALVQLVTLIQMAFTATKRDEGIFYCHSVGDALSAARLVERRFDMDKELAFPDGGQPTAGVRRLLSAGGLASGEVASMRTCSSKPVRNMLRERARESGAVMTDDGIAF